MKTTSLFHHLAALAALSTLLIAVYLIPPRQLPASQGEEQREYDVLHTIEVQLGDKDNRMRFYPGEVLLNVGESYKLVLTNPSPVTHEFASLGLVDHVETDKMDIFSKSGELVAYVRGGITEVELLPGGRIEWTFTAVTPGENIDLFCDIPGHREAGMVGKITIRPAR